MRERKLRSSVNWQGALKKRNIKQGFLYSVFFMYPGFQKCGP